MGSWLLRVSVISVQDMNNIYFVQDLYKLDITDRNINMSIVTAASARIHHGKLAYLTELLGTLKQKWSTARGHFRYR